MRSEFIAVDFDDALDSASISSMPAVIEVATLPCAAVVYSYSDPERTKLSEFEQKDFKSYVKLLNDDADFKKKAREINGRRNALFSVANRNRPAHKYFTYSYRFADLYFEYRSFNRFEPLLSFIEAENWSVSIDPASNSKTLRTFAEWIDKLGYAGSTRGNEGIKYLFKEPLQGIAFASVLACLIKSRINTPVVVHGHFRPVLKSPTAGPSA